MCAESAQGANREQIDFWNGPVAEVWVEAQQRLDASLVVLTEGLVRAAAVRPGERILDIGCGCGSDGKRQHTYDYAEGGCRQVK
ncbi:MAG: hypothetical protein P8Y95_17150, partial [Gammaproteobacteria bacterium]